MLSGEFYQPTGICSGWSLLDYGKYRVVEFTGLGDILSFGVKWLVEYTVK